VMTAEMLKGGNCIQHFAVTISAKVVLLYFTRDITEILNPWSKIRSELHFFN
jgi:hypothetical protein